MVRETSPTASGGNKDETNLRAVAKQIDDLGLYTVDGEGSANVTDGIMSRAHPEYDEESDDRAKSPDRERDNRGRFKAADDDDEQIQDQADDDADEDLEAAGDVEDEDTDDSGDTDEQLADSADQEADGQDEGTDDDAPIETLADFAAAVGVELDDILALTHTFNAAGEEVTVTLNEQQSGYQKDADYRRGTAELSEAKKQAEFQYTEKMQAFEEQHTLVATHLNAVEEMFSQQLNDPNLAALREVDTAEWNARQTEISQQINHVRAIRQQAAQQYANFKQQSHSDMVAREMGQLRTLVPDYNEAKATTAKQTMESLGYLPQEISNMFDHRIVMGALELARLREENATLLAEKKQAENTVKRVKKTVPRMTKPGKQKRGPSKQKLRQSNVSKLNQRLKKTGDVKDAAAVIEEMVFNQ